MVCPPLDRNVIRSRSLPRWICSLWPHLCTNESGLPPSLFNSKTKWRLGHPPAFKFYQAEGCEQKQNARFSWPGGMKRWSLVEGEEAWPAGERSCLPLWSATQRRQRILPRFHPTGFVELGIPAEFYGGRVFTPLARGTQ
jgi:hypothetical protein